MFEIFAIIGTSIAILIFALIAVEDFFAKKEEEERAKREAFAKQVRAWWENPHDSSLRWW